MSDKKAAPAARASARTVASVRSRAIGRIPTTLTALNSLSTDERRAALAEAAQSFHQGQVLRPQDTGWVNVLARTFFSYSVDASSPSRLAWEAVIRGLSVIGSADVDNLGALGEMYAAGDSLGIRATVSLETKASVLSYKDVEVNCQGRPGVVRVLGVGFTRVPPVDSDHGSLIASLPRRVVERYLGMIERLNAKLAPATVDFETDVLPLTPAGNAAKEHIAAAYANKARGIFSELPDLSVFWADVLGRSPNDVQELLGDNVCFMEALSDKLTQMDEDAVPTGIGSYPGITDFFKAVTASGAIPCLLWRDGCSAGEANPEKLLDDALHWGARAVALTPDRNWNLPDAVEKAAKQEALGRLVAAARERRLPLLVGSPMSGPRQKFVDSFDAPEIAAYFRDFTDSAFWLYGHVTLERALGIGLTSEWAEAHFHDDRAAANAFYLEVGKKARPGKATCARIAAAGGDADPCDILDALAPLRL